RHRQTVVHVHLNRDQQAITDLQDRDFAHSRCPLLSAGLARSMTTLPVRRSARPRASAMVAFETTFSSRPRWTIVWAICGRMPLRMQSAPISRAAEIVLI